MYGNIPVGQDTLPPVINCTLFQSQVGNVAQLKLLGYVFLYFCLFFEIFALPEWLGAYFFSYGMRKKLSAFSVEQIVSHRLKIMVQLCRNSRPSKTNLFFNI